MSYILDALKKAERERGIAKVPTLTTVHEPVEAPRRRLWILPAVALMLLTAAFGSILYIWSLQDRPAGDASDIAAQKQALPQTYPIAPDVPPAPKLMQNQASPADALPVEAYEMEEIRSGGSPVPKEIPGDVTSTGVEKARVTPSPLRTSPQPDVRPAEDSFSFEDSYSPSVATAAGIDNRSRNTTLQEAIGGMEISIHLYAKIPANRLVFINGRKYLEGEFVDGRYLIETITPDGVVLSYEGEQATLKATP